MPLSTYTRKTAADLIAAGLAVHAKDTGRTLMLQRAISDDDPASGMWEFPGGHIEPGETPLAAAKREWSEETGMALPPGRVTNVWRGGVYKGYVYEIENESRLKINPPKGKRRVLNPDDPDQDMIETVAWWYPEHIKGNPTIRAELRKETAKVLRKFAKPWTSSEKYADRLEGLEMRKSAGLAFSLTASSEHDAFAKLAANNAAVKNLLANRFATCESASKQAAVRFPAKDTADLWEKIKFHLPRIRALDTAAGGVLGAATGYGISKLRQAREEDPRKKDNISSLKHMIYGAIAGAGVSNVAGDRLRRYLSNKLPLYAYETDSALSSLKPKSLEDFYKSAIADERTIHATRAAPHMRRELLRRGMDLPPRSINEMPFFEDRGTRPYAPTAQSGGLPGTYQHVALSPEGAKAYLESTPSPTLETAAAKAMQYAGKIGDEEIVGKSVAGEGAVDLLSRHGYRWNPSGVTMHDLWDFDLSPEERIAMRGIAKEPLKINEPLPDYILQHPDRAGWASKFDMEEGHKASRIDWLKSLVSRRGLSSLMNGGVVFEQKFTPDGKFDFPSVDAKTSAMQNDKQASFKLLGNLAGRGLRATAKTTGRTAKRVSDKTGVSQAAYPLTSRASGLGNRMAVNLVSQGADKAGFKANRRGFLALHASPIMQRNTKSQVRAMTDLYSNVNAAPEKSLVASALSSQANPILKQLFPYFKTLGLAGTGTAGVATAANQLPRVWEGVNSLFTPGGENTTPTPPLIAKAGSSPVKCDNLDASDRAAIYFGVS